MKKNKKRIIVTVCLLLLVAGLLFLGKNKTLDGFNSIENYYQELSSKHSELSYDSGKCYVNNRILMYIDNPSKVLEIEKKYSLTIESSFGEYYKHYTMEFAEKLTLEELETIIAELESEKLITKGWIDTVLPLSIKTELIPSDPWDDAIWDDSKPAGKNWNMEAINAPAAWNLLNTDNKVNVGIVEFGVDVNHEDLCENVVHSATNNKSDHGTHVTGIISAEWNERGICGLVGKNSKVFITEPTDVYLTDGTLTSFFSWLLYDCNVQVINMSLGYNSEMVYAACKGNEKAINDCISNSELIGNILKIEIQRREEEGLEDFIICCSAGNEQDKYYQKNKKSTYGYRIPGFFSLFSSTPSEDDEMAYYASPLTSINDEVVKEHIIVVGAIEHKEKKIETEYRVAPYSNRGMRVDVLAPGTDIFSTAIDNKYTDTIVENGNALPASGTSFAAPHVAGVAAMLFSLDPSLSAKEVKEIICTTGVETFFSGGKELRMIDANEAVQVVLQRQEKEGVKNKESKFNVKYDKREWAQLLRLFLTNDLGDISKRDIGFFYTQYVNTHTCQYVDRQPMNSYKESSYLVDMNGNYISPSKIPKKIFDEWLWTYFNISIEQINTEPCDMLIFESDADYYYFYFFEGYGILFNTFAYIYDTNFTKDEAIFYVDFIDDFQFRMDEYLDMTREEVLLDKDTKYEYSAEFHFDIVDGRLLVKEANILEIPVPIRYVGKALEPQNADFNRLKNKFIPGKKVLGYQLQGISSMGGDDWIKDGWDGYDMYYGPDFYPSDDNIDEDTSEPVYVRIYTDYFDEDPKKNILGIAAFSDNSEAFYYEDGHIEYYSSVKELNE